MPRREQPLPAARDLAFVRECEQALEDDNSKRLCSALDSASPELLNSKNFRDDATLLIHAARQGREDCLKTLLLQPGIDLESTDQFDQTALHHAAAKGYATLVSELCSAGANTEARTMKSRTPLHLASRAGHLGAVKALLTFNSDVNAQDDLQLQMLGNTALHYAVMENLQDIAKVLLDAGANKWISNNQEQTCVRCLEYASGTLSQKQEMMELMLNHQASMVQTTSTASIFDQQAAVVPNFEATSDSDPRQENTAPTEDEFEQWLNRRIHDGETHRP